MRRKARPSKGRRDVSDPEDVRGLMPPGIFRRWLSGRPPVDGVPFYALSGAQGSGKTTAISQTGGPGAVRLSIDDFYLGRAERAAMSRDIHPNFAVRGAPGTHDIALMLECVDALRNATGASRTAIPRFDKLADDRLPVSEWEIVRGRPDRLLMEGWCVGALPDPAAPDAAPINPVEARDTDGVWRRYQEDALAGPYAQLWDAVDAFLHLEAPGFDVVGDWRLQQEATTQGCPLEALTDDHRAWVANFIRYYERISRRMLAGHKRPGVRVWIDAGRRYVRSSEAI